MIILESPRELIAGYLTAFVRFYFEVMKLNFKLSDISSKYTYTKSFIEITLKQLHVTNSQWKRIGNIYYESFILLINEKRQWNLN